MIKNYGIRKEMKERNKRNDNRRENWKIGEKKR